jgi:hypothetical protein
MTQLRTPNGIRGSALHNTPGDAYKHCLASCLIAQRQGDLISSVFGDANEIKADLKGQPAGEHLMDDVNNTCGHSYAPGNCQHECADAAQSGVLQTPP